MAKEILSGFGVDVDAVAGWLGSYGGEDSPDDISRGLFAGEVGSPRLLKLFGRLGIKTTWFIPGHSIETFPAEMKAVAEAGHEIGIHGYSHENPIAMTREQEMAVLDKCIELVTALADRRPTGYVAPWWEFSTVTNELLLERGIKYDHSLMHHDHQPYYVRVGDSWTKIDYSKQPAEWMVPLRRGRETDLIEIPASWYLDDLPPMLFIKKSPKAGEQRQLLLNRLLLVEAGLARVEQRFAQDSPLEGDGFEPSVPRKEPHANAFKRRCSAPVCGVAHDDRDADRVRDRRLGAGRSRRRPGRSAAP